MSKSKGKIGRALRATVGVILSIILFLAITLLLMYFLDVGNFKSVADSFIEKVYNDRFEEADKEKELKSLQWRLDKLKKKEEQVIKLEDAVKKREQDLLDKEEELNGLIEETEVLKKSLSSQLENLNDIVKLYEKMEPQNAARLLEEAETDFAAYVIKNMNKDTAAEVLSSINTKKAADIINEMTGTK